MSKRAFALKIAAVVANVSIFVMELCSFMSVKLSEVMLQTYTEESNLFAMLVCLLCAFFGIYELLTGKAAPAFVKLLKFMATCCLAVTFFVVIGVLAPMWGADGYRYLLTEGIMLYHHLLCPVVAILSFVLLDCGSHLRFSSTIIAVIPTVVYGCVITVLNLLRVMRGPYPFLYVYEQPAVMSVMWFVVILGGAYLIGLLLWFLSRQTAKALLCEVP